MSFVTDGFCDLGQMISPPVAAEVILKVKAHRNFKNLFMEETKYQENPIRKGVNPAPGRNLVERIGDGGIFESAPIQAELRKVLGPVTTVLDAKFVAAVPSEWIPDWVKAEIKETPVANLGAFVRPENRDITYFHGIDWHQDIIDYPERTADFVTLYVYLDEVTPNDSPLFVLPGSHMAGAKPFPHKVHRVPHEDMLAYSGLVMTPERLTGPAGSAYLWHACMLHGTQPTPETKGTNRISLRYIIAKAPQSQGLLDECNAAIKGPLSLKDTRRDLDVNGRPVLRGNQINAS